MISSLRMAIALAVLAVWGGPATAQAVAVAGSGGQYGWFDLATRQYTQLSTSAFSGLAVTGMAYNSNTSTTYVSTRAPGQLRTINQATGATLSTVGYNFGGASTDNVGLAFNSSGSLFNYNFGNDAVFQINPATGTGTQLSGAAVLTSASPQLGKLAFVGSTLYGTMSLSPSSSNGLYSFNTTNGAATLIGNGGAAATYTDMIAFGSGTNLYGINGTTLYQINIADGALTNLGVISGANLPSSFVAAVAAPVPEPTTVLGVAAAGLGLVRLARRRTKPSPRVM